MYESSVDKNVVLNMHVISRMLIL